MVRANLSFIFIIVSLYIPYEQHGIFQIVCFRSFAKLIKHTYVQIYHTRGTWWLLLTKGIVSIRTVRIQCLLSALLKLFYYWCMGDFGSATFMSHDCTLQFLKSTQYKKLAPNALRFTYQNLKSCKPHEKTKQKTSKCQIY